LDVLDEEVLILLPAAEERVGDGVVDKFDEEEEEEEDDAMEEEDEALVVLVEAADDRREDMEKVVELVDCCSHGEVSSPRVRPRSIFGGVDGGK